MPTVAIMTGLQRSGKTTFCRTCLAVYHRINLDELNTRNKERLAFEAALQEGLDIVVDNTNPASEDRERYIRRAKEKGYRVVGYFMQSRIRACASVLHVEKERPPKLFRIMADALKPGGVMYLSFYEDLIIEEEWISEDVRPDRTVSWLNEIVRKAPG